MVDSRSGTRRAQSTHEGQDPGARTARRGDSGGSAGLHYTGAPSTLTDGSLPCSSGLRPC
ncbi:hypothetical protein RA210_U150045 [Rubrivivax sp. A210]|nr:hypothetical protein RA210_U150045 [Rubrivivax sp. A210]